MICRNNNEGKFIWAREGGREGVHISQMYN
jgi:hypothetical protein